MIEASFSSLRRGFVLLVLLCVSSFCTYAEEFAVDDTGEVQRAEQGDSSFIMVTLPVESIPKELVGYLTFSGSKPEYATHGVFLEQEKNARSGAALVWGASLPAELPQPSHLLLVFTDAESEISFFEFQREEFHYSHSQSPDQIRSRIVLLRGQVDESSEGRSQLERKLHRLQRDAHLIGGFDLVEEVEQARDQEKSELKRIHSQIAQLRRSLDSIKQWPEPRDISERKRSLVRDLQELQAAGATGGDLK
jgi:hypothetical protein